MITAEEAKKIMKQNFIGPDEYRLFASLFPVVIPKHIPPIPFTQDELVTKSRSHILILGVAKFCDNQSLTINAMRNFFGINPAKKEPCLYNQDWYLNENFAKHTTLKNQWYLVGKKLLPDSRGKILPVVSQTSKFPTAALVTVVFFAYWFLTRGKKKLWEHDYVWCVDTDDNGDQIYVGRYSDPKKINKNGFSIHRHLTINNQYGCIDV